MSTSEPFRTGSCSLLAHLTHHFSTNCAPYLIKEDLKDVQHDMAVPQFASTILATTDASTQWQAEARTRRRLDQLCVDSSLFLDQDTLHLRSENMLFSQHGMIGRGSYIVQVKNTKDSRCFKRCIVKVTRPVSSESRLSESAVLNRALGLAEDKLEHPEFKNRLPNRIHSELERAISESHPKLRAQAFTYEERKLRMDQLFSAECLSAADLQTVFKGVFRGYRALYEVAGIFHRDISDANIMYRRVDNVIHGVLNDFDHVQVNAKCPPSSHQRTGTAPFMAIDLLATSPPPPHLYRHDLESLFYVMVYLVVGTDNEYVKAWFMQGLGRKDMARAKDSFFVNLVPSPRTGFDVFSPWLVGLHDLFELGLRAKADFARGRRVHNYEPETLGGHVTFDRYSEVLGITASTSTSCP